MLSRIRSFFKNKTNGRLSLALAISGLIHLWLVGGLNLHLPDLTKPDSMEVLLAPPVLAPMPPPQAKKPPAAKPVRKKAARPKKAAIPPAPPPMLTTPSSATPIAEIPPPTEPATPVADVPSQPATALNNNETLQPIAETQPIATATDDRIDPASLHTPLAIETDFIVTVDGTPGSMHNSYLVNPDGSYVITSTAEAKGFIALFLAGKLVQTSTGIVTAKGLKPLQFTYQYGDKTDKTRRANFDWTAGQLTLETGKNTSTQPLREGTQDMLSSMYQFMFTPPTEHMVLTYTNGGGLRDYDYSMVGTEVLSIKLGEINTIHIMTRNTDGDAKTELWLAPAYYHLPIKLRITRKNGSITEQIMTKSTPVLAAPLP